MKNKLASNIKFHCLGLIAVFSLLSCTNQDAAVPLTASDYPESGTEQVQMYLEKCGECHAAPLPKIHTARQWPGVVQRMQFRMTSKAIRSLNNDEMKIIVGYLVKHAKDSSQLENNGLDNVDQVSKEKNQLNIK